jgi:hypothetical protein
VLKWLFNKKKSYDFYLAGPMRGKPNGNKDFFNLVSKILRRMGHTVWNPAEQNDGEKTFEVCIKKDINAIINECSGILLLPGWKRSLGANAEALCAYLSGKDVCYLRHYRKTNKIQIIRYNREDFGNRITMPFNPKYKGYRKAKEMRVPEKDILV